MALPSANLAYQRLTFGPLFGDPSPPTDSNLGTWMGNQLNATSSDPSNVTAMLNAVQLSFTDTPNGVSQPAKLLPLTNLSLDQATLWANFRTAAAANDFAPQARPGQEILAASYVRAAQSPNQLFEMMVDCWHNHFNVNYISDGHTASSYPVFDQIIRANAFGNFQTLLISIGKSVPMMYYLNQVQSTGSHPNENYAREVMELHTLSAANYLGLTTPPGAEGTGYSDQDVQQAALILSGWYINQTTGAFQFVQANHATGNKQLLGHTISNGGLAESDQMFTILATHPGTANTIATKLYRRFIGDVPPASSPGKTTIIDKMSQTFLDNTSSPNQIGLMMADLLQSTELQQSSGMKFKTPFEFFMSLIRAVNVPLNPSGTLNYYLTNTGDPRYGWVPPNGRPDVSGPWMGNGSLLQRWNGAEDLLSSTAVMQRINSSGQAFGLYDAILRPSPGAPQDLTTAAVAVQRAVASMLPGGASASTLAALNNYASQTQVLGAAATFRSPTALGTGLAMLFAAIAATPEFQFRG